MSDGFDQDAVRRVMRRAVALDATEMPTPDPNHLSRSALVAAAEEVGVDTDVVLLAAAEERLGLLGADVAADSMLDRLAGPGQLVAHSVVAGDAARVLRSLDSWLTRKAGVRRIEIDHAAGRATYRRRGDALAGAQRTVRAAVGRGHLRSIRRVELRVAQLDATRSLAALVADVSAERRSTVTSAAVIATSASAVSAVVALSSQASLWLGVPASCVVGLGIASTRSWSSARAQESLQDVLTRGTRSKRG